ncbi:hypothetical protein H2684_08275 [Clostridium sp. cel8]|uniref:hypothetical protein n=1 Tax=Clostridium sp. cel8 TaxID=2663123 RepID=UPI0015F5E159|nr:hypothetical protein [Clostridium sp. cel8]MBA5851301.1 hypothetical protein [Clostridium sp. cel8]
MISSYPDYFGEIPMIPRGVPVMPGYPSMGDISMPRVDDYEDDDEEDNETTTDNNIDSEDNEDRVEIDKNSMRQRPAGTPSSTGTTGMSTGGSDFEMAPGSPVSQDINYTQGYLKTQIGKKVRVTFLLGTGTLQDRTGILKDVGISYIILRNEETNSNELADIYSIKFVSIFDEK